MTSENLTAQQVIDQGLPSVYVALAALGDKKYWPDIFLGKYDNELKAHIHSLELGGEYPKTIEDFEKEIVIEKFNLLINEMRSIIQKEFDKLIAPNLPKDSIMLKHRVDLKDYITKRQHYEKAGEDFIKNNIADYGGETVAQIAKRLNISKAEVRRRKQNNTLWVS